MKKIFTLMTAVLFAVGASAQHTWLANETAPEKGAKIIDNDLVTVETVYATQAAKMDPTDPATPKMTDSYNFEYFIQIRTANNASASDVTGGDNGNGTPLIITAKKNVDMTFYFRRQAGDNFKKDDGKDMLCFAQNGKSYESEEEIVSKTASEDYGNAVKTYKFVEGGVYTIYRKGSTICLYAIDAAAGTATGGDEGGSGSLANGTYVISWDEEPTLSNKTTDDMANTGTANNVATWKNGFSVMIMRSDKGQSSAKEITVDGKKYKTIKVSNGAQNKLILPEGKITKKITLYSYVNADAATDRPSYWKEVAGQTYTEADLFESYNNYESPDKREYTFPAANEVTFTNTGEQNCYVLFVEVEDGTPEVGGDKPGEGGETEGVAPILVKDATTNGSLVVPEVVVDPAKAENHCIKVASPANATEEWDAQIFISAPEAFKEGDVIALAMSIKADAAQAEAGCQLHSTPGNYQHWQATGNANFTTEWTEYKGQYTINGTDGIGAQTLAFNLSVQGGSANNLYFDDIVLTVNGKEVINESFGDSVAAGIIFVKTQDGENGATYNLAGQKVDENYKGVVIKNGKKFIQK